MKRKQTSPKLSIIVPVYNVETYISECLDSLRDQTLDNSLYEVLIIDDKGSDSSMSIAKKYAANNPDIFKIITHKKNKGLAAARNTGFSKSKGSYITFIDSDDFVDIHTYSFLIDTIEREEADIVLYAYEYYSESGTKYARNPSAKLFKLNKTISRDEYPAYPELMFALSACNKIYRREIVQAAPKFPEGKKYEDAVFSISSYLLAKNMHITDKAVYYYRKRESETEQSIMDEIRQSRSSFFDHLLVNKEIAKFEDTHPYMRFSLSWFSIRSWHGFIRTILLNEDDAGLTNSDKKTLFKETKKLYENIDLSNVYRKVTHAQKLLVSSIKEAKSLEEASALYSKRNAQYERKRSRRVRSARFRNARRRLFSPMYLKRKITREVDVATFFFDYTKHKILAKRLVKNNNGKKIQLFYERGNEAKDNAFALFKYVRENYPDELAYYVISKENKEEFNKAANFGNVIEYGSKKHKTYFVAADALLCTHARGTAEPWSFELIERLFRRSYYKKKYIFLQHGVIMNNFSKTLGADGTKGKFDLFICGAKPEYDYIKKQFGYDKENVLYSGLARYDELQKSNSVKKQILLMPSWRSYVVQPSWNLAKGRTTRDLKFLKSQYYKRYQSLLNSPELKSYLEKKGVDLVFYPHYEVQQYLDYFHSDSDRVKLASSKDYDVQELLKESAFLITDYSSVIFDFAYMNKPMALYQFDESKFFSKHYQRGYFSYRRDGFGPVVMDEADIIEQIKMAVENNFKMRKEYIGRANKFFVKHDSKNSQRIYDRVREIL